MIKKQKNIINNKNVYKKKYGELKIATFNVRGLSDTRKGLWNEQWDIVNINETKLNQCQNYRIINNSFDEIDAKGGQIIVIHNRIATNIINIEHDIYEYCTKMELIFKEKKQQKNKYICALSKYRYKK